MMAQLREADDRVAVPVDLRILPPPFASELLNRDHLVKTLVGEHTQNLVLVNAPVGFGKTSLMVALSRSLSEKYCAWLKPRRYECPDEFLSELAVSCRLKINGNVSLSEMVKALVSKPGATTFLIDDCEKVLGSRELAVIVELLEAAPTGVRFILASRAALPVPNISNLILRGLVRQIGWKDLVFSEGEVAKLVPKGPENPWLPLVLRITKGWPAAVRIAALGLANDDPKTSDRFMRQFASGSHDLLHQFVLNDVLPSFPEGVSKTAKLFGFIQRLERGLLDAFQIAALNSEADYSDFRDSEPLVRFAEDKNCFEAHPVLKATLRNAFSREPFNVQAEKHRKAARWFADNGHLENAVHQAAEARDYSDASNHIRKAGSMRIFLRSGFPTLNRLMVQLPSDTIQDSSALKLCQAVVYYKQGHLEAARTLIDSVKADMASNSDACDVTADEVFHVDTLVGGCEDRACDEDVEAEVESRLQTASPRDFWLAGWLLNHRALSRTMLGKLEDAEAHALKALRYYKTQPEDYAQAFMYLHLALLSADRAKPASGLGFIKKALNIVEASHSDDANLRAVISVSQAEVLYALGRNAEARVTIDASLEQFLAGEVWVDLLERIFLTRARIAISDHDTDTALGTVDMAEQAAGQRTLPRLGLFAQILKTDVLTRTGLTEAATENELAHRWLSDADWPPGKVHVHNNNRVTWREWYFALLTSARLCWSNNDRDGAIDLLDRLCDSAKMHGADMHLAAARALQFCYLWHMKEPHQAREHFQLAVALATPQQLVSVFSEEGAPMAIAIRGVLRRFGASSFSRPTLEFTNSVLKAHLPEKIKLRNESDGTRIEILLTEHEREILGHLAAGLSNKAIGLEVGRTEATVKYHLRRIYEKFGVKSRGMAIAMAKDLSIVP